MQLLQPVLIDYVIEDRAIVEQEAVMVGVLTNAVGDSVTGEDVRVCSNVNDVSLDTTRKQEFISIIIVIKKANTNQSLFFISYHHPLSWHYFKTIAAFFPISHQGVKGEESDIFSPFIKIQGQVFKLISCYEFGSYRR